MHSLKLKHPSLNALASCAGLFTALYPVFRLFVSMLLYLTYLDVLPAELTLMHLPIYTD